MTNRPTPEERKAQILAAATAVFARKGFDGASMDDIVEESGLSKGGLYWHFNSKDDIITAILAQFFDQEMAHTEAILAQEAPAGERLLRFAHHLSQEIEEAFGLLPISLEFYAVAARQESVRHFMRDYFTNYHNILTGLMQDGIDAGEFRADVPAGEVATTLIALFEGLVLLWAIAPDAIDLAAQSQTAIRLLLDGLDLGQD